MHTPTLVTAFFAVAAILYAEIVLYYRHKRDNKKERDDK